MQTGKYVYTLYNLLRQIVHMPFHFYFNISSKPFIQYRLTQVKLDLF